MNSLLVIKPSSLGDIVHGLQVVQAATAKSPDLRVTWVVRERFSGLVKAAPFIAETIIFRRRDGWRAFLKLLRELNGRRFDAVWDMQGLLRSGLMTAAANAPEKWGRPDSREGARFFCNRTVDRPTGAGPHHALEILLPFARSLDAEAELQYPLRLTPDPEFAWDGFFCGDPKNTFVVFTDSRGAEKQWPHFIRLLEMIFAKIPESRVAWCAGKKTEVTFAAPIGRLLNLTGCPLDQMIALVRKPAMFIGNDSGPMHLAAACGNRVLAIFGPTSPRRFGPFPLEAAKHRAVSAAGGRLDCLEPEAVLAGVRELQQQS